MPRGIIVLTAALGAALLLALPVWAGAPAQATRACPVGGYSYAGYASRGAVAGIAATVAASEAPHSASGHTAAWVGVGGLHAGPGGRNEWLQVGLASLPGSSLHLYYELALPNARRRFAELGATVRAGQSHRLAVVEVTPGRWRVFVDGRAVSPVVGLPLSHGVWPGVATAESWTEAGAACNRYGFQFGDVSIAESGEGWRALRSATPLRATINRLAGAASAFAARS